MKIISVVGARPNFMKMAPIHKAFSQLMTRNSEQNSSQNIQHLICHTGQHYDDTMSKIFFDDLGLPEPDYYLGVGSGSHAEQTAKIMIEFEKVIIEERPELVIVYGDVNSTAACSMVASKLGVKIAHVESGLRSFDRTMPEEINRVITDHLSDFLFVTEKSGVENLRNEGISKDKIFFVGNTMIDSLIHYTPKVEKSEILKSLNLNCNTEIEPYCVITLHRPSNVDLRDKMIQLIDLLNDFADEVKIVFPIHPRTRKNLCDWGLENKFSQNILLIEPIGYIDFLTLIKNAVLVLTDSGGIQEETTYLGVQCITIRDNTERPITVEVGTNHLIGTDLEAVKKVVRELLKGNIKSGIIPDKWDGKAAERISKILIKASLKS